MDLRDVALLLEVVRVGSVQRAARALNLSRSTVRRQLANLEDAVGAPLLVRTETGVSLTSAGAVVVDDGQLLLGHSQRMLARVKASHDRPAGTVRIILPTGIRREIRLWLLQRLHDANPDLRIEERESEDPLTLVHEPFDLMFYIGGPPPLGEWFSRVLARIPFRLFAARRYLERAGTPKDLDDLASHAVVTWHTRDEAPEELPLLAGGTFRVNPWFVSHNLENVMALVRDGLAIALGPVFMDNEGLVPFLGDVVGTTRAVRMLSPQSATSDARVNAFHQTITQFFASLPEP